jgi:hypothetical protein
MSLISASICLSKLPKDKIKQGSDGKLYMNITVADRKEADQYGNTHTIFVSQTKEKREAKTDKVYVGQGRAIEFAPAVTTPESVDDFPVAENTDDLPF